MSKKWRLTDRTRTLLLMELAITLPALALMGFSIWNLKHIQRDKQIEAAISRDLQYVLKGVEHKAWDKSAALITPIQKEFPSADDPEKAKVRLGELLTAHPEFAYAILYDKKTNRFISREQPARENEPAFCAMADETINSTAKWLPLDASPLAESLRMMEKRDDQGVVFMGDWSNNNRTFTALATFIPSNTPPDRVTIAMLAFDPDFLKNRFFPAIIKDSIASKNGTMSNPPAIILRNPHEYTPWVASENWDGGKPEVDRSFMDAFRGLTASIKYPGKTVADMSNKFLLYNYTVLGALSLFMIGGILLTYRNISREMKLAKLKSDFVANVSHELRTPLALIRLYAETLELGRLNSKEKYQEYFRIIREESERLTALINNILDFSRIEAGRKEYEFKETNLAELVRSTLESYRFQIEQHGFSFEENISNDVPPVTVDREAIARSLLNLVNNALKYSRDKKYIGVNLYRSNGSVNLEVCDHGIGISPDEQEKIFEKFYRCGDPLVHNIKGSGLGLSLVRHIARAHGGDVTVVSAPEEGSKFTIALPIDPSLRHGASMA
ncbi:MAG TPA: HAMP domain-containing sensor histidine kinase [Candidatus Saccharimonadales bacterium]|nr:HAMP domain-containing sensor histidine kinase [Candidatus Saccharimonadales bacterium]